jgi:hypothetical protein
MPNWGLDDDVAVDDSRAPERELVPEGDHTFRIKEVIEDGDVVEIRLEHEAGRQYRWVFQRCQTGHNMGRRILSTLRKAFGMSREEWAAAPITDLVGRVVRARIYHRAGATGGKTFVNVGEFLPGPAVETATTKPAVERAVAPPSSRTAPPARRTKTQQADAASGTDGDDIPF